MMRFFPSFRRSEPLAPVPLELISIHIPKTAGTTFQHMLAQQFGEQHVERIDFPKNEQELSRKSHTSVVHGHISFNEAKLLDPSDSIPRITWVRNPVDRVISNYNYLSERLTKLVDEPRHGVDILSKLQRSLLEFASDERMRNRISKFLMGSDFSDYAFIGIVERYGEDLRELQNLLGWKAIGLVHHNSSSGASSQDTEIRAIIEELNEEDMRLYREVLKFRKVSV